MARYHIDKNGRPAICKATKRPCPLGGVEAHFDSLEEAQVHVDKQNEAQFGLLSVEKSFNEQSPFGISKDELLKNNSDLNAIASLDLAMNAPSLFAAASDHFENNGKVNKDVEQSMRERGLISEDERLLTPSQYEAITQSSSVHMERRGLSDNDLKKAGLSKKMRRFMHGPLKVKGTGAAFIVHNKKNDSYKSVTQLEAMTLNPNPEWAKSMTEGMNDDYPGHIYEDYRISSETRVITEEQFNGGVDTGAALTYELHKSGVTEGATEAFTSNGKLDSDYVSFAKDAGVFKGDVYSPADYKGDPSSLPMAELSQDDMARLGVSPNVAKEIHKAQHDDGSAAVIVKDGDGFKRYNEFQASLIYSTSPKAEAWRVEAAKQKRGFGEKFVDVFKKGD